MKSSVNLRKVATLAMITALAYATVLVFKLVFPIQIAGFLSVEPKDSLLAIAAFLYGPVAGLLVSVLVAAVECVTVSTTGVIGLVMNVLSSALFICPAAAIYRRRPSTKTMLLGLACGVLLSSAGMVLWHYLITPLYMGVPRSVVAGMLLPTILPFNLLKSGINAALLMLLYTPLRTALGKAHLLPEADTHAPHKGRFVTYFLPALFVLITLSMIALVWAGVL